MKTKKEQGHVNHERWLVSYADFITLMFAFFVVLFASSQVNKKKVATIAAYFNAYIRDGTGHPTSMEEQAEGAHPPENTLSAMTMSELKPVKEQLGQELAREIQEGKISLSLQPRGLVLSLRESTLFPPGRDTFCAEALPILTKVAGALQKLSGQPVRLEGHTDDIPIETEQFPSNWELSAARATAVLDWLVQEFHIEQGRLAIAGYADYHPVANNDSAEGRARNRRVDIVILSRSAAEMEPRQIDGRL